MAACSGERVAAGGFSGMLCRLAKGFSSNDSSRLSRLEFQGLTELFLLWSRVDL